MRSTPRILQMLGLLLIVIAGLIYTYHLLAAWPWLTVSLVAVGALIAVVSTILLHSSAHPSQSPAGKA